MTREADSMMKWGVALSAYIVLSEHCDETLEGERLTRAHRALIELGLLLRVYSAHGESEPRGDPVCLICEYCRQGVPLAEVSRHTCPQMHS